MREKVLFTAEQQESVYSPNQWEHLSQMRKRCSAVMKVLLDANIPCFTYGSIARGDVTEKSDIDILVPDQMPSYRIELALEENHFAPVERFISMATPNHTPKAFIALQGDLDISFPLLELRSREAGLFNFAGKITLADINQELRVKGVNKKLLLITPTTHGHLSVGLGNCPLNEVAKELSVDISVLDERIRVLRRRDQIGRTGIYVKYRLSSDEQFEQVFRTLSENDPAIRRFVRKNK